jgi:pyruvate dehydrogenase E1 component beta subunit
MDVEAIAESVRKTNRAVVLEEGWEVCGIGAQVVDYIQRECFDHLDAPVLRVHQEDVPMPYAKALERAAKPDAAKTIAAVKKVMYIDGQ